MLVIKHATSQNQVKVPKTNQNQPKLPAELSKNHLNKQRFHAVVHL